jgi:hypothetical protein
VDSIHGRFQDSIALIKQKVKSFLDSTQGDISLCLFDSILGGKRANWDQTAWGGKDFEEALTFAEVNKSNYYVCMLINKKTLTITFL